jgi:hypothetical protein
MTKRVGLWPEDQLKGAIAAIREGMFANRASNVFTSKKNFAQ